MRRLTRISILAAILIIASFEMNAQAEVKILPKVGINVSNFNADWDDFENYENGGRVGWQAGIDVRVGKYAYFAPGLHYSSTTLRDINMDELENNTFSFGEELTVQSLKLPLNVGLKVPVLGLRVQGGITGNYALDIKDANGNSFDPVLLNRVTASTNLGVGMDILWMTVDFNYEKGITDYFNNVDIKNNTYSLTVGLKF